VYEGVVAMVDAIMIEGVIGLVVTGAGWYLLFSTGYAPKMV